MAPDPTVIAGAARTLMGAFLGDPSPLAAPQLGAAALCVGGELVPRPRRKIH